MPSVESTYQLKRLKNNAKKWLLAIMKALFFLAAVANFVLLAYEFGYPYEDEDQKFLIIGFGIILRIFFYGGIIKVVLFPKSTWREKGFWIEIALLILMLVVILTQSPYHFPNDQWWQRADHFLMHALLIFFSIIELSKAVVSVVQRHIKPEMMFIFSFLLIIIIGCFLLMLPLAHNGSIGFIDALFTSVSAVCVNGMTVTDTAVTFTHTGHVILITLIQIGGIGVMAFTSFIAMSFFNHTSFNDQMALKNILYEESMNNIFKTLLYTFFTTLIIETLGAYFIWTEIRHIPAEIIPDKIFFSIFYSISAFCNAGFSILSDSLHHPAVRHLYGFQNWIAILIILGGIGFPIIFNYGKLLNHKLRNVFYRLIRSSKRMPSHVRIVSTTTRVVIATTILLLVSGTLLFWLFENNNVLENLSWQEKLSISFFNSVTPRSGGFNNLTTTTLTNATLILTILLMWIGASPLSCGGGIKTTTFTIAARNIISLLQGKNNVEVFKRQLSIKNVRHAHVVIILSLLWIGIFSMIIAVLSPHASIAEVIFETTSAFSTTGLSLGLAQKLDAAGKLIISLTMFVGRIGLITLLTAVVKRHYTQTYTYAEDNIIL